MSSNMRALPGQSHSATSPQLYDSRRRRGRAPGRAGVSPASREARTRMRAFGPPCRRDAGAPRQFTDERGQEDPGPGRPAPGATPLPTSPLPGGRSHSVRASDSSPTSPSPGTGAARPLVRRLPGPRSSLPPALTPPPFRGEVGRGVPHRDAPACPRGSADARPHVPGSAGGVPAHLGSSPMSGIRKAPVQAVDPLGHSPPPPRLPPSRGRSEDGLSTAVALKARRFPRAACRV